MPISLQEILSLETQVWEALKRGDAVLDAAILAENFLGIYPTGFATRDEHCAPLKCGPTVAEYKILNPKMIELGEDLALLAYLARWSRLRDGKPQESEEMYISSIWRRYHEGWKNIFSQDTPRAS